MKRTSRMNNIRRITISEVNTTKSYVNGVDRYGKSFRVSFSFHNPVITIPQVGETWTIRQYQQQWYLDNRQLTDFSLVSSLNAGDKLIDSTTSIILSAPLLSLEGPILLENQGISPTPPSVGAILFTRLNGSNKTELCVQFPTGNPVIIATES